MDKNGLPKPDSLANLYSFISRKYGKGKPVKATYHEDADYDRVTKYANDRLMKYDPYSLLTNNCFTFRDNAIEAGRKPPVPPSSEPKGETGKQQ